MPLLKLSIVAYHWWCQIQMITLITCKPPMMICVNYYSNERSNNKVTKSRGSFLGTKSWHQFSNLGISYLRLPCSHRKFMFYRFWKNTLNTGLVLGFSFLQSLNIVYLWDFLDNSKFPKEWGISEEDTKGSGCKRTLVSPSGFRRCVIYHNEEHQNY